MISSRNEWLRDSFGTGSCLRSFFVRTLEWILLTLKETMVKSLFSGKRCFSYTNLAPRMCLNHVQSSRCLVDYIAAYTVKVAVTILFAEERP